MDCFGIGTTRLLAASVEVLSSQDKVQWPRLIAPYQICIIPQKVILVLFQFDRIHVSCQAWIFMLLPPILWADEGIMLSTRLCVHACMHAHELVVVF